jgi:hypothetical protein
MQLLVPGFLVPGFTNQDGEAGTKNQELLN